MSRRKRSVTTQTPTRFSSSIVFNAYSVTSAHITNGQCVTTSGSPITLPTPYSFTVNTLLPSSQFQSSAFAAFIDFLGFTSCVGGGEYVSEVSLVSVDNVTATTSQSSESILPSETRLFNSSVTSTLSSQQTSPSAPAVQRQEPSTGLRPQAKIGIAIGASLSGIIILFLALRDFRRYRKRKIRDGAERQEATSEEDQPYFQQKGELEAEERRKYELEAEERRYELEENEIKEMPTMQMKNDGSTHRRQELRGEEHCKELNGSES
ncbi:MAG: hypothetical protein Q9195_008289 [Heterodermia aff. obscurata]